MTTRSEDRPTSRPLLGALLPGTLLPGTLLPGALPVVLAAGAGCGDGHGNRTPPSARAKRNPTYLPCGSVVISLSARYACVRQEMVQVTDLPYPFCGNFQLPADRTIFGPIHRRLTHILKNRPGCASCELKSVAYRRLFVSISACVTWDTHWTQRVWHDDHPPGGWRVQARIDPNRPVRVRIHHAHFNYARRPRGPTLAETVERWSREERRRALAAERWGSWASLSGGETPHPASQRAADRRDAAAAAPEERAR